MTSVAGKMGPKSGQTTRKSLYFTEGPRDFNATRPLILLHLVGLFFFFLQRRSVGVVKHVSSSLMTLKRSGTVSNRAVPRLRLNIARMRSGLAILNRFSAFLLCYGTTHFLLLATDGRD